MVYFICENKDTNNALFECEIFWNEEYSTKEQKYLWNIDMHSHFYAANLIVYVNEHPMRGTLLENFVKDVKELSELRGWLWEKTSINNELDKTSPNAPSSSEAEKKVEKYCGDVIQRFADKWGFTVKID